jgi:hypothetical protein
MGLSNNFFIGYGTISLKVMIPFYSRKQKPAVNYSRFIKTQYLSYAATATAV